MTEGNWSLGPPAVPGLSPSGLHQRLEWAVSVFRERGVIVSDGCRAYRALRFLASLAGDGGIRDRAAMPIEFDWFVAHQRTALELFLIAIAMTQCPDETSPFTPAKLQIVVRGPEWREGRDTSARNMQFELLTAARFVLGGVGVRDGEPDIVISFGAEDVGVAAKRLTSLSDAQVRRRVHEAIRQIERTPYRGIVAVNLEGRIGPVSTEARQAQLLEAADRAYEMIGTLACESVNNHRVLGMIAFDSLIRAGTILSPNDYPSLDATTPVRYWVSGNIVDRLSGMQFFAEWRDQWLAARSQALADFIVEEP